MSSIMSKQLGEFLQEQQEPFILEVYLLERGYSTRRFSEDYNVGTMLKRSVSSGLKRNKTFIPNCSRLVRGLFSKLLTSTVGDDNTHKTNDISAGTREKCFSISSRSSKENSDDDKFSSASSATIFNSCSESDDAEDSCYCSSRKDCLLATTDYYQSSDFEHTPCKHEVDGNKMLRWNSIKLSPVSILDRESNHASPFHKKNDDSISRRRHFQFSALLHAYNRSEKPYFFSSDISSSSSQYTRNMEALKQTERILVDCVREVVQRVKKDSRTDLRSPQILGSDQIWELIRENISAWSKEPINETNTSRLVHLDVLASAQEWSKFEQEREELSMLIADAILEDIIRTEIIRDMTNHKSS